MAFLTYKLSVKRMTELQQKFKDLVMVLPKQLSSPYLRHDSKCLHWWGSPLSSLKTTSHRNLTVVQFPENRKGERGKGGGAPSIEASHPHSSLSCLR